MKFAGRASSTRLAMAVGFGSSARCGTTPKARDILDIASVLKTLLAELDSALQEYEVIRR